MSVSNACYEFAVQLVTASTPSGALYMADVHENLYQPYKAAKTIRVGDVQRGNFGLYSSGSLIETNAFLTVQFVVKPEADTLDKRIEARDAAVEMAKAFATAILSPSTNALNDADGNPRVCDTTIEDYAVDWRDFTAKKVAASYLLLKFNARG